MIQTAVTVGTNVAPSYRTDFVEPFDAQCLAIYQALCEEAAAGWRKSGFRSLAIVFFPDLQRLLTAWLQFRLERQLGIMRPDLATHHQTGMPYADAADLDHGPRIDDKRLQSMAEYERASRSRAIRLAESLLGRAWRRPAIGIRRDTNFGTSEVISAVLRAGGWPILVPSAKLGGVDFQGEWPPLRSRLDTALTKLGLTNEQRINLLGLAEAHMRADLTEQSTPVKCDLLVCGGTAGLPSRMVAAQARTQGIPVISVTHGESDGGLDEPYFRYGEYTYATHVLSFGIATTEAYERSHHMRCLFEPDLRPEFIPSNADTILPIYQPNQAIRPLTRGQGTGGLYVPCTFSGANVYGPFRALPDTLYLRWQETLLANFPDAQIKPHPNSDWPGIEYPPGRVKHGRLTEVMLNADFFIFDYVSTALTQAMATDKPIIFFDIGLNHLDTEAAQAIKDRCIHLRVDDLTAPDLAERALAAAQQPRFNRFTPRFSLAGGTEPRIAALERTIRKVIAK